MADEGGGRGAYREGGGRGAHREGGVIQGVAHCRGSLGWLICQGQCIHLGVVVSVHEGWGEGSRAQDWFTSPLMRQRGLSPVLKAPLGGSCAIPRLHAECGGRIDYPSLRAGRMGGPYLMRAVLQGRGQVGRPRGGL